MLQNAISWLHKTLQTHVSVPVVYHPAGGTPIPLDAIPGRTLFRAESLEGLTVRTETRDFLIAADKLPREPRRGDVIMYNLHRCEVLAPHGEAVWRWTDPWHSAYRIHTKETLP